MRLLDWGTEMFKNNAAEWWQARGTQQHPHSLQRSLRVHKTQASLKPAPPLWRASEGHSSGIRVVMSKITGRGRLTSKQHLSVLPQSFYLDILSGQFWHLVSSSISFRPFDIWQYTHTPMAPAYFMQQLGKEHCFTCLFVLLCARAHFCNNEKLVMQEHCNSRLNHVHKMRKHTRTHPHL